MKLIKFLTIFILSLAILLPSASDAQAKKKRRSNKQSVAAYNPKYSDLIVNADTGKVLHEEDSTALRYPASLTKMMTIYLLFEKLHNHQLSLSDKLNVSAEAAGRPQTNMSLSAGDRIEVEDTIHALIIRSANDVAVVVAENLAGSEEEFAKLMTARARQLGMKKTTFKNASGLHHPSQITTARDMAILGIALKKHYPEYYHYFADSEFDFRGKTYTSHNRVTMNYPGADGLKTGFIGTSGFNLTTSATRRGVNLVGVVLGGRSWATRDRRMMDLLDEAFAKSANDKFGQVIPNSGEVTPTPVENETNNSQASSTETAPTEDSSYNTAQKILKSPKETDKIIKKIKSKKTKKSTAKPKKKIKKKSAKKKKKKS